LKAEPSLSRPNPLSPTEAFEAIQKLLELRDSIGWTNHAKARARERQFTGDDVRRVLVHGTVGANPEWKEEYQN
jgi:hypothetical protein